MSLLLIVVIIINFEVSIVKIRSQWTSELDRWTGLVDWTGGLNNWAHAFFSSIRMYKMIRSSLMYLGYSTMAS